MGVTKLLSFAREAVPNGSFTIDIKEEIRKFYSSSTSTNPPAPIIVVDLMCIVRPFIMLDAVGVLCGGRYNHISRQLDAFFGEMKNLGAELAFFWDGPITMTTDDGWCKKRDHKYQTVIELFDAVDQGFDIFDPNPDIIPFHYTATVKQVAMRHGRYYYATSRECDQDMVAFANNSRALAIITNDSDMLIYGGSWRFWCTNGLNMANLTIVEYDRVALRSFLQLSTAQMSLMATLVGNDIINSSELYNFHKVLGRSIDKITNVADFILTNANKSADGILIEALEFCSNRRALMKRFKMSLAIYNLEKQPFISRIHGPIEDLLLSRGLSLFYNMWTSSSIQCSLDELDIRDEQLGQMVHTMIIAHIRRMGGIILYKRQMQRRIVDYSKCHILTKLQYEADYACHEYSVEFPTHIEPPPLEDLLSDDPVLQHTLLDTKHELLSWILFKNIVQLPVDTIPQPLQITVFALYCLVERKILMPFEADLLLKVAHDVTCDQYDPDTVSYPQQLASRPFRVAFAFEKVYVSVAKAFNLVGLTNSVGGELPFDGVLFHNWYDDWKNRRDGDETGMEEIEHLRLYKTIATDNATDTE
ncbi:uncharacterized protein LOC134223557 isoform X1 [Armigeres subalbatus]|uniref:uncharacterized protein LOC134223557 isoform X1 n=1 Tax=Armigeres subalbatus TaxID=124917 RepID=UPI002ED29DF9